MKCTDCPYFWADVDNEGRPIENARRHYAYDDGYAPCEVDEIDDYNNDEE